VEALSLDRHQKKARRLNAYLVFLDESGFLLLPTVRRTWAPRGVTPLLRHRYRRDKVSAISAVTVSPRRHRCGLYAHFHCDNITQVEVALFLRLLLRHLAGSIIVLWDGGTIHGGPEITTLLARHPRLHVERFPAYAPELNPDELVWHHLKGELANGSPDTVDALLDDLTRVTRGLRRAPALLRAFIVGSELPRPFSA
jgi:transposase